MATSSIFHNVKLDTPEKAEAFVSALEASAKDPYIRSGSAVHTVNTDPNLTRKLHDMRKKAREESK